MLPFICSAPSFKNTAPNDPKNEATKTRRIELSGVFIGLFLQPEHGDSADYKDDADRFEEVHMLAGQEI